MKEKRRAAKISFIINIVVLAVLLLLFYPEYETNDDNGINAIANGLFGTYDEHLVFVHIWLGRLIVFLNKLVIGVNWYTVLQYVSVFTALWVLSYILIRKKGTVGVWLSLMLLAFLGFQVYVAPQFTKTSGILTIAGGFAIVSESILIIPGIILMLLGSMWRGAGYSAWIALLAPFVMVEFWRISNKRNNDRKQVIKKMGVILICFIVVFGAGNYIWKINTEEYEKEPEWAEYVVWGDEIGYLIDYFFPYYYDDYELYQSLGISKEDLEYYESWNIGDAEVLNMETISLLNQAKEAYWISPKTKFLYFLQVAPGYIVKMTMFPLFVIMLIVFAFFREKRTIWFLILQICEMLVMYFYLFYQGRVFVNRVDVPIWLPICYGMMFYISNEKIERFAKQNRKAIIALALGGLFIGIAVNTERYEASLRKNYNWDNKKRTSRFLEEISLDKEHLYVGPTGTIPITGAIGIFERKPQGYLSNAYGTVGWLVQTPTTEAVLRSYNIQNVYRDSVNASQVYWVAGFEMDKTFAYIRNNYVEDAEFELVDFIEGYEIYSAKSQS